MVDEPVYDNKGNLIGHLKWVKVWLNEDEYEMMQSLFLLPYFPPLELDPDAKLPKGCKGKACCFYESAFLGHWFLVCLNQTKCIIRRAGRKEVSEQVLKIFQEETASLSQRAKISYIFENMPWHQLGGKTLAFIEDLLEGDYGFKKRRSLSPKQYYWLELYYLQAQSKELDDPEEY